MFIYENPAKYAAFEKSMFNKEFFVYFKISNSEGALLNCSDILIVKERGRAQDCEGEGQGSRL